jgi:hypothetical protein
MFATSRHIVLSGLIFGPLWFMPTLATAQEQCWARTDAMDVLARHTSDIGGDVQVFAGAKAESFLSVVNQSGQPTDFHADEIAIALIPQAHVALVFLIHQGCTDPGPITIGADLFLRAYHAAMLLDV